MTEQRRHPRAPIPLEVRYQRLNSFFADYAKNVSKGGLFVKTDRALRVGTRFVFQLVLPGGAEPLQLEGEVVHDRAHEGDPGMGIRFVWPDAAARESFESLVERLMTGSLGPEAARALLGRRQDDPDR